MSEQPQPAAPSRKKIAVAAVVAVLVAGVVLVVAVLPAEYGIDPLGIGEALGLVILNEPTALPADEIPIREGLTAEPRPFAMDTVTFELAPGEGIEYKYRLDEGEAMLYSWRASGFVRSEMHSENDDAPPGTADFFEVVEDAVQRHGSYTAPFSGIHGWYWLNLNEIDPITLTLQTAGFYDGAQEFRATGVTPYEFSPIEVETPPEQ